MSCQINMQDLSTELKNKIYKDLNVKLEYTSRNFNQIKFIETYLFEDNKLYAPMAYAHTELAPYIIPKEWPVLDLRKYKFCLEIFKDKKPLLKSITKRFTEYPYVIVQQPTGKGKTIIGTYFWSKSNLYGLTIFTASALIDQWVNVFSQAYPELSHRIWTIDNQVNDPVMIVILTTGIQKVPQEYLDRVGFLIIDEIHTISTKNRAAAIMKIRPKYILAETATLGRKNKSHSIAYRFVDKHSIREIMVRDYTVIRYNTKITANPKKGPNGINYQDLLNILANSEKRNRFWVEFIKANRSHKVITLTYLQEHVLELFKIATQEGIPADIYYGDKANYSDKGCLIGTVSKMGFGFDEANKCEDFDGIRSDVLILMISVKAEFKPKEVLPGQDLSEVYSDDDIAGLTNWQQIVGRIRAKNPFIIYFVDSHPIPQKHFRDVVPWIEQTGGKVLSWDVNKKGTLILP